MTISIWEAATPERRARCLKLRHELFCEGRAGEKDLEKDCQAPTPDAPHDRFDAGDCRHFLGEYNGRAVAYGRLPLGPDLPTAEAYRKLGWMLPSDMSHHAEPSRLGMEKEFQGVQRGLVLCRLVGAIIERSLVLGYPFWLLTFRERLFRPLSWFPFDLDHPFRYSSEAGGPNVEEAIYPATMSVPEIVKATWQMKPREYALMFPDRLELTDWDGLLEQAPIRPADELAGLAAHNIREVQRYGRRGTVPVDQLPVVPA
jgi:hypothetical protein